MVIGSRVMRIGWKAHPDFEHLARLGTVRSFAGRQVVVEWDAGRTCGTRTETLPADALTVLWWRST